MNEAIHKQLLIYFKQQSELGIPDYIFSSAPYSADNEYRTMPENSTGKTTANDGSERPYTIKRAALVELYREIENCQGCDLGVSRNRLVFGGGKASAPLMIIGEAPGFEEDLQGKPFVGRAGALLTKMLAAITIDREKGVFITNILKCRPPENRNPSQTEVIACMPILRRQIRIIDPKAILALGRIAAHELLNVTESIGKLRAETHNYNGIPVIITYHPAALLRNERYKRPAWEDLQRLQQILKEKGVYGTSKD